MDPKRGYFWKSKMMENSLEAPKIVVVALIDHVCHSPTADLSTEWQRVCSRFVCYLDVL